MADPVRVRPAEERLPWLEPVEEEAPPRSGAGRMILLFAIVVLLLAAAIGTFLWVRAHDLSIDGSGELIAAPRDPYRVKPEEAGGMAVEGTGELSYRASEGADIDSAIDLTAVPETPVTGGKPAPAGDAPALSPETTPAPVPAAPAAPAQPLVVAATGTDVAAPAAAAAPSGTGAIQLGAFSSEAKARAAWKSLSGRFAFLAAVEHGILPVKTDSATLYRLRATGLAHPSDLCARLKIAGESCAVVN